MELLEITVKFLLINLSNNVTIQYILFPLIHTLDEGLGAEWMNRWMDML